MFTLMLRLEWRSKFDKVLLLGKIKGKSCIVFKSLWNPGTKLFWLFKYFNLRKAKVLINCYRFDVSYVNSACPNFIDQSAHDGWYGHTHADHFYFPLLCDTHLRLGQSHLKINTTSSRCWTQPSARQSAMLITLLTRFSIHLSVF